MAENPKKFPLILFPNYHPKVTHESSPHYVLDYPSQKYCYFDLPDIKGTKLCGSSLGYLIMAEENSSITLINPLSKPMLIQQLPQIEPDIVPPTTTNRFVHKAILSSDPIRNPNGYIVLAIIGESRKLTYYKAGSDSWMTLEEAGSSYTDIVFEWGAFYGVDEYGKIVQIYKLDDSCPLDVLDIARPWSFKGDQFYIVNFNGELCLVLRFLQKNPKLGEETYAFEVYRYHPYYQKWVRINSIDNWMIFLGLNHSMALQADCSKRSFLKADRIYFTDDLLGVKDDFVVGGNDMGFFSLKDENTRRIPCPVGNLREVWPRSIWYMPNT